MPDIFSGLAAMWQKPAIISEVLQEAPARVDNRETVSPAPHPPKDPFDYALEAQRSLLDAGFSDRRAFAGALTALAWERPLIANKSGKSRRMSQKASRAVRALAGAVMQEE